VIRGEPARDLGQAQRGEALQVERFEKPVRFVRGQSGVIRQRHKQQAVDIEDGERGR